MADCDPKRVPKIVAGCPWCGDGTPLKVKGDGFGGVSLCCLQCDCRGPAAPIESGFAEADDQAISAWSKRSAINPEVLERVKSAASLAAVMNGGRASGATEVPVRLADLAQIIRTSRPDWLSPA